MRLVGILFGVGLVVVGVPLTFTPLPVGLPMTGLGVVILVASSPFVARRLKAWRAASKTVDRVVDRAEDMLPEPLRAPLERTEPEPQRTARDDAARLTGGRTVRRMSPRERGRTPRRLR